MIGFEASTGRWYIAFSDGKSFGQQIKWLDGHGVGSHIQLVEDVNGDGKADAIVYFIENGSWYVSLSNGSSFGGYWKWIEGYGNGSSTQFLGDVNGDGKADAVVYYAETGMVLGMYRLPTIMCLENIRNGLMDMDGFLSTKQLLGDVNGDGKLDSTVHFALKGSWYVSISNGQQFNAYNKWIGLT